MELYKLLSSNQKELKSMIFVKDWQFRIRNGLTYEIQVRYKAPNFSHLEVRLNDCLIEKRIKGFMRLPIVIEGIEFIVKFQAQTFQLIVDQKDIEEVKVVYLDQLTQAEYQQTMNYCDTLIQKLFDQTGVSNKQESIKLIGNALCLCDNNLQRAVDTQQRKNLGDRCMELRKIIDSLMVAVQIYGLANEENGANQRVQIGGDVAETKVKEGDDNVCIICMERPRTHAPLPCGHRNYCDKCSLQCMRSKECFVCKQPIVNIVRIYD